MNDRKIIDREPVALPVLSGIDDQLWLALIELAEVQPDNWTLIGGQMVLLHAIEHDAALVRLNGPRRSRQRSRRLQRSAGVRSRARDTRIRTRRAFA